MNAESRFNKFIVNIVVLTLYAVILFGGLWFGRCMGIW